MLDTTSKCSQANEDAFVLYGWNESREELPEAPVGFQHHQPPAGFY